MTQAETASEATEPNFENLLTWPVLIENLKVKMGFKGPTPIQKAAMPAVLSGRDIYAGAKTGSGKTIAFLAPLAERIKKGEIHRVLILAPTRELVLQMDEEAMRLLDGQTEVVSVPLYGGVPVDPQILAIKAHKPRLFIATPGRVLDLFSEGVLPIDQAQVAVLDEADRMCDMGFAPQVTQILDLMKERKQMLLFSATLPKELTEIMSKYCPNPERIQVDAPDQSSETITHRVIFCPRKNKIQRLVQVLTSDPSIVSVSFSRTRTGADRLYDRLRTELGQVAVLHAGLDMNERERTLRALKDGRIKHLVATDVFARGIDVDFLTHVIHFDLSGNLEEYIHRSGRSGRAGREGTTIAFVESDNPEQLQDYQTFAKKVKFLPMPGEELPDFSSGGFGRSQEGHRGGRSHGRNDRGGRHDRGGERSRHSEGRYKNNSEARQSGGGEGRHSSGGEGRPPREGGHHRQDSRGGRHPQKRHESSRPPRRSESTTTQRTSPQKTLLSKTKSFLSKVFGKKT